MKSTWWDTRAAHSIIRSGQKETEASIKQEYRDGQIALIMNNMLPRLAADTLLCCNGNWQC